MMRTIAGALLVVGAQLLGACGGSGIDATISPPPPPPIDSTKPTSIVFLAPPTTPFVPGAAVQVSVRVLDLAGRAAPHLPVTLSTTSGTVIGGSAPLITDVAGVARSVWNLGTALGQQTLTASILNATLSATLVVTVALPPISGTWSGSIPNPTQVLTMTIVENNGVVSGSGTITNTPTGTRALVVNGTFLGTSLAVTFSSGTSTPFGYQAELNPTSGLAFFGLVSGSGFNDFLTLTKQ